MLINLLNTLLIACGMAYNTTNFNYQEKATRRNATETVGIGIHTTYLQKGTEYSYTNTHGYQSNLKKYVLKNENSDTVNTNYTHPYLNISNTIYSFTQRIQYGTYNALQFHIYQFTNYYNSTVNVNIEMQMLPAAGEINQTEYIRASINTEINAPIDLTLTANTQQQLETYTNSGSFIIYETRYETTAYPSLQIPTITFQPNETKTLSIKFDRRQDSTTYQQNVPLEFTLNGTATIPSQPLEVIDVPSLMFTVLSMPFSFISQAFNLTIFPNTPYQINFSNLFLTIISIFVMLWLIKHIFK